MKIHVLVALLAVAQCASARELRYFNVVPIMDGNVEFAAREVRRQAKLGVKAVAVMLSYHPQCTPASALLPVNAGNFRRLKAELAGSGVEVGVLVQSTAGHGWNGKMPLTDERWQKTVLVDGSESPRFCQLDAGFRAYVLEAIRTISREGPSFLLIDDDFGPRDREGFCPLHAALYNRVTGESRTAEAWGRLAGGRELGNPLRRQMEEARRQVPIAFAREIRRVIDSVDPRIRCGMCTPVCGTGFTREVALALAGPNTQPFVRICNSVYGRRAPSVFYDQLQYVRQQSDMFRGIGEIVAEADTWPQNHWSEPACFFAAHLYFDVLYGLDGAKIWMSEFERPVATGSQARYERAFSEELPMRQALYDLVKNRNPVFHGLTSPVNWGTWSSDSVAAGGSWAYDTPLIAFFMQFGFPCEMARVTDDDPQKVWVLTRTSVGLLSDDELRTLLARRVFVDSAGAKALTKRGFASLLGVEATDGPSGFAYNRELPRDGQPPLEIPWDGSSAHLRPLSEKVEVLSDFTWRTPVMERDEVRSPALTLFTNEKGGKVAVTGWTYANGSPGLFAKYMKVARKELLTKVADRLFGGVLPFVACENNDALVSWSSLSDGATLVSATNVSVDDWPNLRLRMASLPKSAKMLRDDGTWQDVEVVRTAENEVTFQTGVMRCLKPVTLLLCGLAGDSQARQH